ncbi:Hydrogenobyrinate a,c-diamide synthase [Candidatus Hodgkinia cicadicola]|uniref:Hydrogenobyrinate a,c-diamide synthase n=1 Tax=Candidatus Hodgkinia cicadicola TaxID=573658 RepID=A0ABX4MH08_9HYPH|nr:Hydrogenobyrinate a,c-diamide synthase [Candidatus Hodgkinia cicadicola]
MFVLCALKSSEGKTQLTCGLAFIFYLIKLRIETCKIGPDYIDVINIGQISNNPTINLLVYLNYKIATWFLWIERMGLIEDNMGLLDGISHAYTINTCVLLSYNKNKFLLILNCKSSQQTNICIASALWSLSSGLILNNITSYKHEGSLLLELKSFRSPLIYGLLYKNIILSIGNRYLGLIRFAETDLNTKDYLTLLIKQTFNQCNIRWIISTK